MALSMSVVWLLKEGFYLTFNVEVILCDGKNRK